MGFPAAWLIEEILTVFQLKIETYAVASGNDEKCVWCKWEKHFGVHLGCSSACIAYCKVVERTRLCDEMYCTLLAECFSDEAWLLEVEEESVIEFSTFCCAM